MNARKTAIFVVFDFNYILRLYFILTFHFKYKYSQVIPILVVLVANTPIIFNFITFYWYIHNVCWIFYLFTVFCTRYYLRIEMNKAEVLISLSDFVFSLQNLILVIYKSVYTVYRCMYYIPWLYIGLFPL